MRTRILQVGLLRCALIAIAAASCAASAGQKSSALELIFLDVGQGDAAVIRSPEGKVALVGGASKGLGRACAEVLAQEGVNLTICSRTQADLEQAAEEIRQSSGSQVLVHAGNLDSYETIQDVVASTVEHFGQLDILINNSGGPPLARAATADEDTWNTAIQRSLLFFARMPREATPHMKRQGGGRII